jgi:hypothetical protein
MSEHVQEGPVEGRLQVPRGRALRERGGGAQPLRGRSLGAFWELHDHAGERVGRIKNQRTSQCSVFLMFVVHNFSPNHFRLRAILL